MKHRFERYLCEIYTGSNVVEVLSALDTDRALSVLSTVSIDDIALSLYGAHLAK